MDRFVFQYAEGIYLIWALTKKIKPLTLIFLLPEIFLPEFFDDLSTVS